MGYLPRHGKTDFRPYNSVRHPDMLTQTIPSLHLTSETLTWDPLKMMYTDQEAAMTDFTGAVETRTRVRDKFPAVIRAIATSDLIDLTHDDYFVTALLAQVVVSQIDIRLDQTRPDQTIRLDQTRPDQTIRLDQTRPDQTRQDD